MTPNAPRLNPKIVKQQDATQHILQMLAEIQFGSVEITLHDNKITQIERKEKIRPQVEKT